jgi:phosphate transport system substrate-binding protein
MIKISKFAAWQLIILLLTMSIAACKQQKTEDTRKAATLGKMEIWCDESVKKIISQEEDVFEFSYKYADLDIKYATEDSIYKRFYTDSSDVIIVSHPLDTIEIKKFNKKKFFPRQFQFAVSAIAFITSKENKGKVNYSFEELSTLLMSNDANQIFVVENKGSGLAFDILRHTKANTLSKNVFAQKSKNEVIDYVTKNPGTIGIIDWSEIGDSDDSEAKALLDKIQMLGISTKETKGEFVYPYQYNLNGLYPFTRDLYIIRKQGLNDVTLGFASFVCSDRGQKIILKSGLLPQYQTERWIEFKGLKDVEVIK